MAAGWIGVEKGRRSDQTVHNRHRAWAERQRMVPDSGEFSATHLPRGEERMWSSATSLSASWDLYNEDQGGHGAVAPVQRWG